MLSSLHLTPWGTEKHLPRKEALAARGGGASHQKKPGGGIWLHKDALLSEPLSPSSRAAPPTGAQWASLNTGSLSETRNPAIAGDISNSSLDPNFKKTVKRDPGSNSRRPLSPIPTPALSTTLPNPGSTTPVHSDLLPFSPVLCHVDHLSLLALTSPLSFLPSIPGLGLGLAHQFLLIPHNSRSGNQVGKR